MNLNDNISRINELILINESKNKINVIKGLIDNSIQEINEMCHKNDDYNEYITQDTCELLLSDFKYTIEDIYFDEGKMMVKIKIQYRNYQHFYDWESFEWDIRYYLKKLIPNVDIKVIDSINNFDPESRQW